MALSNYAGGDDFLLTGFYNNLRQDFYRGQQAEAQMRAAEQKAAQERAKEINGMLAKVDSKGIRPVDVPGFVTRYDELTSLAGRVRNAETTQDRAQAAIDFQRKLQDLNLYNNKSIFLKDALNTASGAILKDPEAYTDKSTGYFRRFVDNSIDKLGDEQFDTTQIVKRPDQNLFEKDVDDIFRRAGTTQDVRLGGTLYDNNGNKILKTKTTTTSNAQDIMTRIYGLASSDSNTRRALAERYPQLPTLEQQVEQFMRDNDSRRTDIKVGTLSSSKGKSSGDGDDSNIIFSTPTKKTFVGEGNKSGTSITSDKFQSFNGGLISLPQMSRVFNVNTQENESNVSFKGATVTGVGHFPQKGTGKSIAMVSVTDGDGQEYLIPEDKVPLDFRSKKLYKKAKSSLGEEANYSSRATSKQPNERQESISKLRKKQPVKEVSSYKTGQVVGGYKFKGGDPTKQSNWVKI